MLRRRRIEKLILICGLHVFVACRDQALEREAAVLTGSDPARGKAAISRYGCAACHEIPGVRGADALVGPPLPGIASRSYIGGVISNSPDYMIQWIENPPAIDEKTAMPNLGVTASSSRALIRWRWSNTRSSFQSSSCRSLTCGRLWPRTARR